jgi:hypothetical protein
MRRTKIHLQKSTARIHSSATVGTGEETREDPAQNTTRSDIGRSAARKTAPQRHLATARWNSRRSPTPLAVAQGRSTVPGHAVPPQLRGAAAEGLSPTGLARRKRADRGAVWCKRAESGAAQRAKRRRGPCARRRACETESERIGEKRGGR